MVAAQSAVVAIAFVFVSVTVDAAVVSALVLNPRFEYLFDGGPVSHLA